MQLYQTAFPNKLSDLRNLIFYGPKGVGKYTQMLVALSRYSPTALKYEKKVTVTLNKHAFLMKISDVHFEIDMALLGCQAKLLWHEIYSQIIDIILARTDNTGIIVCKGFQDIHAELLETFYSYMQTCPPTSAVRLTMVLLTEELSFIPDNILNCCQVITVARPTRALYNSCLANKLPANLALAEISNIKNLQFNVTQLMRPHEIICQKILDDIKNPAALNFLTLRENLYDIFIYNLNLMECIWYIVDHLTRAQLLQTDDLKDIWLNLCPFLQYFNNNYRPIYHLENY